MIDLHGMLTKSLNAYDAQRDRSQQVEVGPSSIGGCRRRVWHDLKQTPTPMKIPTSWRQFLELLFMRELRNQ